VNSIPLIFFLESNPRPLSQSLKRTSREPKSRSASNYSLRMANRIGQHFLTDAKEVGFPFGGKFPGLACKITSASSPCRWSCVQSSRAKLWREASLPAPEDGGLHGTSGFAQPFTCSSPARSMWSETLKAFFCAMAPLAASNWAITPVKPGRVCHEYREPPGCAQLSDPTRDLRRETSQLQCKHCLMSESSRQFDLLAQEIPFLAEADNNQPRDTSGDQHRHEEN